MADKKGIIDEILELKEGETLEEWHERVCVKDHSAYCMRCGAELIKVKKEDYVYPNLDEDCQGSVSEWKCPECGTYYSVTPPAEEDKMNYPFYNEELQDGFCDSHHGYDGFCPECGSHIVWSGDFMRSEVWGDTEKLDENGKPIVDEYGIDVDDSLVSYVSCPYCGAYIEIVEAKPSELEALKEAKENDNNNS